MAVQYPVDFPLDEIKSVIDMVRNRSIRDNVNDFAHAVWVIQGYAQRTLLGESSPNFAFAAQDAPGTDAITELEKVVSQAESGSVSAQMAVPWGMIIQWLIKELLVALADRLPQ